MLSAHGGCGLHVCTKATMWETEARLVLLLLDYFSVEKGGSHGRGEDQSLLSLDCPTGDISQASHELKIQTG